MDTWLPLPQGSIMGRTKSKEYGKYTDEFKRLAVLLSNHPDTLVTGVDYGRSVDLFWVSWPPFWGEMLSGFVLNPQKRPFCSTSNGNWLIFKNMLPRRIGLNYASKQMKKDICRKTSPVNSIRVMYAANQEFSIPMGSADWLASARVRPCYGNPGRKQQSIVASSRRA